METVVISGSVLYISLTLFCFSHAYIVLVHHLSYLDLFIYFKSILGFGKNCERKHLFLGIQNKNDHTSFL